MSSTTRPIVRQKGVIEIAPDIALEKQHNGRLSVWMIRTTSTKSLDRWFDHLRVVGSNADPKKPTYTCIDVATSRVTVTPYMRKGLRDVGRDVGQRMAGRTAYVLKRSVLSMVVRLFVLYDAAAFFPHMRFEIFYDVESALAWLEEGLLEDSPPSAAPTPKPNLDQS